MTSPTLREALEDKAREVLTAVCKERYQRTLLMRDSRVTEATAIAAMLAFATTSHEAGRRAGLEEAARVAEECAISVPLAPGCVDGASIAARTIAAAIRNLAGDEEIGDG